MEITKLEKTGRRYRVYLNDEPCFCLPASCMGELGLAEGMELAKEKYDYICEYILIPGAKQRSLDLLNLKDRTEKELRDRLKRDSYPPEAIHAAVEYVKSFHYIDDSRYAAHFAQSHSLSLGKRAIRMELIKRGIDSQTADEALEMLEGDESRTAIEKWLKKRHYDPQNADEKERAKQIRFLCGKGFDYGEVIKTMENYL